MPLASRSRSRAAIVAAILLLAGWALAGPGRLSTAALLEREHCVELSVADGHVDLRLGHGNSAPGGHRHEEPTPADHVLHLCASADLLAPRAPAGDAPMPALLGSSRWARGLALRSSPRLDDPPRPPSLFAPARSLPLLL